MLPHREIAANVARAADGSRIVSANVEGVAASASDTTGEASRVLNTADVLGEASQALTASVEMFLNSIGQDLDERRRNERTTLCEPGTVEIEGRSIPVEVVDISAQGARLDQALDLTPGTAVRLKFEGLVVLGRIVWTGDAGTGIEFERALAELPRSVQAATAAAA